MKQLLLFILSLFFGKRAKEEMKKDWGIVNNIKFKSMYQALKYRQHLLETTKIKHELIFRRE